jgi:hypothetical protein
VVREWYIGSGVPPEYSPSPMEANAQNVAFIRWSTWCTQTMSSPVSLGADQTR